ncbi:hypothetical protein [Hymenobacter arizonensis]|uniref:Glycosyl transferase family 8 n=1 Tax=Hymenobacter arizonensis TaxID=1227077 RepID=A0A1I6BRL7_HYMAR|nr:hypothetical protein [Hymenobacter arizonensis]SFQ83586.1 hypothetical protein SAMN04515668_4995 [Hymenobacter arizonensis]
MNKIKGQGTLTKALASKTGARNKRDFVKFINAGKNLSILSVSIKNEVLIEARVVSFSSTHDFGEQVLSILSFIKYVGTPIAWIVYSDGTHTSQEIELIESSFDFLKVENIRFDESYIQHNIKKSLLPYKKDFINYANALPLGKKLFYYLNTSIQKPTFFLDSDVLFYNKSCCLLNLIKENYNGWFLPDSEWGNLDPRYIEKTSPQHYQVNSGLFLINKELDSYVEGLSFLSALGPNYHYFSEQTVVHILLTFNRFMPLDPRIFVLDSADQFDFSYRYTREGMAVRHYTGPVRHKMWQRDWKWHLSLT